MGFAEKTIGGFERLWSASSELRRGGPPEGFLQRRALSARLWAALLLIVAVNITHSPLTLAGCYLLCACLAYVSHLNLTRYLVGNLVIVAVFAMPLALFGALGFVTPGRTLMRVGSVEFTHQGAAAVGLVVLRTLCAVGVTMLLLRSAGFAGVLRGAREAGVPSGLVAALQMTLAHIHVLGRTAEGMVRGLRARTIAALGLRRAYTSVSVQGATLLQKSLASSRQVHAAMLARGFTGVFPSPYEMQHCGLADRLLVVGAGLVLALAVCR